MSKFLTFEIKNTNPLPYILLFNDDVIDQISERDFYKDSLIYFICKVQKVRFDIDSLKVSGDTINVDLLYQKHIIPAEFSVEIGKNNSVLPTSNSKKLDINVDGVEKPKPMVITPDLVLRQLNGNIGNKPEIIYIGYSLEPIRRLRSHEKIVRANAELNDSEEIRLYINSFKFSLMEKKVPKQLIYLDNIGIKKGVVSDETLKKYVKMVERIFIHYFQTEGLNENHINMNITQDPILKELLTENGITFFGGIFEMEDGDYFDFWSKNQTNTNKSFFFNFDNPGLGYINFDKAKELFLK